MNSVRNIVIYLNKDERRKLQRDLLDENYYSWSTCGAFICLFQLFMLGNNIFSGFYSERTYYYRMLYSGLIIVTLLEELMLYRFWKNKQTVRFYASSWFYMLAVFLWSVGITAVGYGTRQDLSTFAYTLISCSAILLMEPWIVIVNLALTSLLLDAVLTHGLSLAESMSTHIQIASVFVLAVIVAVVVYNRRLKRARLQYVLNDLNIQLSEDAHNDALTGIRNRRYLTEHIDDPLNIGGMATGVLMIDIDRFKQINDTYGHQFGDECLMLIGSVIRKVTDGCESYAVRYGGEEFMVCFERIAEKELREKAERIRAMIAEHSLQDNGNSGSISVSIGWALAKENMSYSELIGQADESLYLAKESGRNCVRP